LLTDTRLFFKEGALRPESRKSKEAGAFFAAPLLSRADRSGQ